MSRAAVTRERLPTPGRFRALAAHGFSVIPVRHPDLDDEPEGNRGKRPIAEWKSYQVERSTAEALTAWEQDERCLNVAVVTGQVSKIVVLDIDSAETLRELEARKYALPQTPTVRTGRGRHVYFAHPGCEIGNRTALGGIRGLDFRGDGGYAIGPGSVHENGVRYAWEISPADSPFAPVPSWLIELHREPGASADPAPRGVGRESPRTHDPGEGRYALAALEGEVAKVRHAMRPTGPDKPGNRNDTLNRAAFALGQLIAVGDLDRGTVEAALYAASVENGLVADDGERTVRATIQSGIGAGLKAPRVAPSPHQRWGQIRPGPSGLPTHREDLVHADPDRFFKSGAFRPALLADELMEKDTYLASPVADDGVGAFLYAYRDGVYRRGEACASRTAERLLGARAKNAFIDDAVKLIRRRVAVGYEKLNPHGLDLINVENGMLDWRSGKLLAHAPEYLSTIRIPVRYVPDAQSPIIDRVFREWLPEDVLDLAGEVCGHLLLPSRKHQAAVMLKGEGENGKSTFLNLTRTFLGRENVSSESLHDLEENRFRAASLFGKLANLCADIDDRALKCTSMFKKITGDDSIAAERKHQHPFEFDPFARLIFSANTLPTPRSDHTHAFFRRWIIVPFQNSFSDRKERDRDLLSKITTPEALSALLNIALVGLRRLEERGEFSLPASVQGAGEEYRRDSDAILAFLSDECAPGGGDDWLSTTDLYARFTAWCRENGYKYVPSKRELDQQVTTTFSVEKGRRRMGGRGNAVMAWRGVTCQYSPPMQQVLGQGGL